MKPTREQVKACMDIHKKEQEKIGRLTAWIDAINSSYTVLEMWWEMLVFKVLCPEVEDWVSRRQYDIDGLWKTTVDYPDWDSIEVNSEDFDTLRAVLEKDDLLTNDTDVW